MRQFGVHSQLPLCSWIEIKCSFSPCWLYNMATLMTSVHTSYTLERKESKMYCIYPNISQPTNGKCFISEGGEGRGESRSRCACIPYCLKLMTGCLSYSWNVINHKQNLRFFCFAKHLQKVYKHFCFIPCIASNKGTVTVYVKPLHSACIIEPYLCK